MNLGEMVTLTRTLLGDSATTKYHDDDEVVLFLNEAALTVASKTLSTLTFAEGPTTVGDERYPLPLLFLSLRDVHLINGQEMIQLERLSRDQYEDAYGRQQTGQGRPVHFKIELGQTETTPGSAPGDLWLRPIPDLDTYTIRIAYYRATSRLSFLQPDDSYELKLPFHRPVCYHAAIELAFKTDDTSRMAKLKGMYDQSMAEALELIGRTDLSEPFTFEKSYGGPKSHWRRRR